MKFTYILASASPRRQQILHQIGLDFTVMAADIDETPKQHESPSSLVKRLAKEKAAHVKTRINSNHDTRNLVIIAADTTVAQGDVVFGKPEHATQAKQFLRTLSSGPHDVYSGVCLLVKQETQRWKSYSSVVKTRLTMRALTEADIVRYIESQEGLDKAGGYAIQGTYGPSLIESVHGSYSNVVGLPVSALLGLFKKADCYPHTL